MDLRLKCVFADYAINGRKNLTVETEFKKEKHCRNRHLLTRNHYLRKNTGLTCYNQAVVLSDCSYILTYKQQDDKSKHYALVATVSWLGLNTRYNAKQRDVQMNDINS